MEAFRIWLQEEPALFLGAAAFMRGRENIKQHRH